MDYNWYYNLITLNGFIHISYINQCTFKKHNVTFIYVNIHVQFNYHFGGDGVSSFRYIGNSLDLTLDGSFVSFLSGEEDVTTAGAAAVAVAEHDVGIKNFLKACNKIIYSWNYLCFLNQYTVTK